MKIIKADRTLVKPNRILFVCKGNVDRSRAGADVYGGMLLSRGFRVGKYSDLEGADFYVGSAGIEASAPDIGNGSIQLTRGMTDMASRIFSVDGYITFHLKKDYGVPPGRIVELGIEDGRSLIIEEEAQSLYDEFRRKLACHMPKR